MSEATEYRVCCRSRWDWPKATLARWTKVVLREGAFKVHWRPQEHVLWRAYGAPYPRRTGNSTLVRFHHPNWYITGIAQVLRRWTNWHLDGSHLTPSKFDDTRSVACGQKRVANNSLRPAVAHSGYWWWWWSREENIKTHDYWMTKKYSNRYCEFNPKKEKEIQWRWRQRRRRRILWNWTKAYSLYSNWHAALKNKELAEFFFSKKRKKAHPHNNTHTWNIANNNLNGSNISAHAYLLKQACWWFEHQSWSSWRI